jgi:hypothetical protein
MDEERECAKDQLRSLPPVGEPGGVPEATDAVQQARLKARSLIWLKEGNGERTLYEGLRLTLALLTTEAAQPFRMTFFRLCPTHWDGQAPYI